MAALSWGVHQRAKRGNAVCGDAYAVVENGDRAVVAVVDGLGSGPEASEASQRAVEVVREQADAPLNDIIATCNDALRVTRGAAVGLLGVDGERRLVEYSGVGNIEVRTLRDSALRALSVNGIVGTNYRTPRLFNAEYQPGEWLVLYTDGLRGRFDFEQELRESEQDPQALADHLGGTYARPDDDITVVVVRLH